MISHRYRYVQYSTVCVQKVNGGAFTSPFLDGACSLGSSALIATHFHSHKITTDNRQQTTTVSTYNNVYRYRLHYLGSRPPRQYHLTVRDHAVHEHWPKYQHCACNVRTVVQYVLRCLYCCRSYGKFATMLLLTYSTVRPVTHSSAYSTTPKQHFVSFTCNAVLDSILRYCLLRCWRRRSLPVLYSSVRDHPATVTQW